MAERYRFQCGFASSARISRLLMFISLWIGACIAVPSVAAAQTTTRSLDGLNLLAYELLNERCGSCHDENNAEFDFSESDVGYMLDFERLFSGEGSIVECQKPLDQIYLLKQVSPRSGGRSPEMPEEGEPLTLSEINLLQRWIKESCDQSSTVTQSEQTDNATAEPANAAAEQTSEVSLVATSTTTQNSVRRDAKSALQRHCGKCHNAKKSAGGFTRVDDLAYLESGITPRPYVNACEADESLLLTYIENGSMPKNAPINDDPGAMADIASIRSWIEQLDGSRMHHRLAEHRQFVSAGQQRELALQDLMSQPSDSQQYMRYLTLANLYNSSASDKQLKYFRLAAAKLVNVLSMGSHLVAPVSVSDSNDLLYRIDIRDYAWTADYHWDLLERAYPYAVEPFQESAYETLVQRMHARVPMMRLDWLAFSATRPPLYHDLLQLPDTEQALEVAVGGSGFNTQHNYLDYRVVRAGFGAGESGVSFNSRLIERHELPRGGVYWKSYDFGGKNDVQNLERTPFGPVAPRDLPQAHTFKHDGGEIIFSLPNRLHGYYLATETGKRIDVGPSNIVHDSSRLDRQIINGISCISCHSLGMQVRYDQIRSSLLSTDTSPLRPRARKVLERLHPDRETLDKIFKEDQQSYLGQLAKLGLAESNENGEFVAILAPGELEPIRYMSDFYENALTQLTLAAELDLPQDDFAMAARSTIAARYVHQSPCARVERETFEREFAQLVPLVTADKPMFSQEEHYVAATTQSQPRLHGAINAGIELEKTDYRIGEEFVFHVTSQQDCQFMIFTIDAMGKVELHDPKTARAFMGDPILRAGERRRIPVPGAPGIARIDPPEGTQQVGMICSSEELSKLGISDYQLRTPAGAGKARFSFVTQKFDNRFRADELSRVTADLRVTQ